MSPSPTTPEPGEPTTAEDRAAYHALIEDVLTVRDMYDETSAKLEALMARGYPDRANLRAVLAGRLPEVRDARIDTIPVPIPTRQHPGQARSHFTKKSHTIRPIPDITFDLVRDNPGRTSRQLKAALRQLPEGESYYEDSLSPTLSNLSASKRIVRVLCDTALGVGHGPGTPKVKYYVPGAVPSQANVVPHDVSIGRLSRGDIMAACRPPTPKETGEAITPADLEDLMAAS